MYQRDLDALIIWGSNYNRGIGNANLRYVTHVPASGRGIGIFPLDGDPVVFSEMHHMYVPESPYDQYQSWVDDTRPFHGARGVIEELERRGLKEGTLGIVGHGNQFAPKYFVPYPDMHELKRTLTGAEIVEATDLVERDRLIKSDEQIEMLRHAGTIANAMAEELTNAEPGQLECEVYADVVRTMIASGGEPYVFNFFDSGPTTSNEDVNLLHGKQEPLSPTTRELEDGDLILTEFHAGYGGVLAAAEKSVVLGSAPDELLDIHNVSVQCLESLCNTVRPGATFGEAIDAVRRPVREAGMDFIELGMHGHGYGSPEFPAAVYPNKPTETYPDGMAEESLSPRGIEDVKLREGMVFGTNIDVYDPNWRDDVGVMFGDMILVTENGAEQLVETTTEFVV
jgi:Xaa-Pro aminopeptidase